MGRVALALRVSQACCEGSHEFMKDNTLKKMPGAAATCVAASPATRDLPLNPFTTDRVRNHLSPSLPPLHQKPQKEVGPPVSWPSPNPLQISQLEALGVVWGSTSCLASLATLSSSHPHGPSWMTCHPPQRIISRTCTHRRQLLSGVTDCSLGERGQLSL